MDHDRSERAVNGQRGLSQPRKMFLFPAPAPRDLFEFAVPFHSCSLAIRKGMRGKKMKKSAEYAEYAEEEPAKFAKYSKGI